MKPERFISTVVVCCALGWWAPREACAQLSADGDVAASFASPAANPFVREQLRFTRVRAARSATESAIEKLFKARNIAYPAAEVYLRAFKLERTLELWVRSADKDKFELLKAYRICALAGGLGPKRKEGDGQVPEGFYLVDMFNPNSAYHLSIRIDYPNVHDQIGNSEGLDLGGEIYIHGGCRSDGCLAITDEGINEVYWIALTARAAGQQQIPVHIFPGRFNGSADLRRIEQLVKPPRSLLDFWQTLKPGYDYFERHHRLPNVVVDVRGRYHVAD
ncbi:MAG TPA: L,D-transpeptidase family protein [Longimicrobiales bacterium]|nr:L,D-transpeptidase family protein [Longimicrobiales bacterium]